MTLLNVVASLLVVVAVCLVNAEQDKEDGTQSMSVTLGDQPARITLHLTHNEQHQLQKELQTWLESQSSTPPSWRVRAVVLSWYMKLKKAHMIKARQYLMSLLRPGGKLVVTM